MGSSADTRLMSNAEFDVTVNLASTDPNSGTNYSLRPEPYETTSTPPGFKAQKRSKDVQKKQPPGGSGSDPPRTIGMGTKSTEANVTVSTPKSKRVRTGCLTCRERHLKCDEAVPRCQNCQKSDRLCKRGVRLNFIDTQVTSPPYVVPYSRDRQMGFQDESREIASEYQGGFERYPVVTEDLLAKSHFTPFDFTDVMAAPSMSHQSLPVTCMPTFPGTSQPDIIDPVFHPNPQSAPTGSSYSDPLAHPPYNNLKPAMLSSSPGRPYLNDPEEVLLMQVFVEEVGIWMDSMDSMKHFTHILPFHALSQPMLLNASMACGARHLFLVNPSYGDDKAVYYCNAASMDLLASLQTPNRDSALCAITAVILNVYEIMCDKPSQRMNHIAGARALIKECRWNGKSSGIGLACFWLNIGMELLTCLHFKWTLAWDPDTWGIDMNISSGPISLSGDEEHWTHRMLYICGKVCNFRSAISRIQGPERMPHDMQIEQQFEEWNNLKNLCDEWARRAPRSMLPLGYLHSWQTNSKSSFPESWVVKRSSILGRLFYHTSLCLLAQLHPFESECRDDMIALEQTHAYDICGLVTHVKDRGVASVSLRCLAIAAECLTERRSQEEVLTTLEKIIKETGWRADQIRGELTEIWGWNAPQPDRPQATTSSITNRTSLLGLNSAIASSQHPVPGIPAGIVNPLLATADFSVDNHPYQSHYVAPQPQLGPYSFSTYS